MSGAQSTWNTKGRTRHTNTNVIFRVGRYRFNRLHKNSVYLLCHQLTLVREESSLREVDDHLTVRRWTARYAIDVSGILSALETSSVRRLS